MTRIWRQPPPFSPPGWGPWSVKQLLTQVSFCQVLGGVLGLCKWRAFNLSAKSPRAKRPHQKRVNLLLMKQIPCFQKYSFQDYFQLCITQHSTQIYFLQGYYEVKVERMTKSQRERECYFYRVYTLYSLPKEFVVGFSEINFLHNFQQFYSYIALTAN